MECGYTCTSLLWSGLEAPCGLAGLNSGSRLVSDVPFGILDSSGLNCIKSLMLSVLAASGCSSFFVVAVTAVSRSVLLGDTAAASFSPDAFSMASSTLASLGGLSSSPAFSGRLNCGFGLALWQTSNACPTVRTMWSAWFYKQPCMTLLKIYSFCNLLVWQIWRHYIWMCYWVPHE